MTILETRPFIPTSPDTTGGMELLIDMLRTKKPAQTGEFPIVEADTTAQTAHATTPDAPAEKPVEGFIRRTLGRVKAAITKAVATVREATQWLFSDLPDLKLLARRYRKGRHQVKKSWFGVQRSTAAAVLITRERHARGQQTSTAKEGALSSYYVLPEYWVSHMAELIECLRENHSIFHPSQGRHWECS